MKLYNDTYPDNWFEDYPKIPIGGNNPYNMCAFCHRSVPEINYTLEGHSEYCTYRKQKESELLEKLVTNIYIIEYSVGDCECSYVVTQAFEYKSAEDLLIDLEAMAKEYIAECEHLRSPEMLKAYNDEWTKACDSDNSYDEIERVRKKYDRPYPVLKWNGYCLPIANLVSTDYYNSRNKMIYVEPSIYTFEEWVKVNKEENQYEDNSA